MRRPTRSAQLALRHLEGTALVGMALGQFSEIILCFLGLSAPGKINIPPTKSCSGSPKGARNTDLKTGI
jgi:hypothetical protein